MRTVPYFILALLVAAGGRGIGMGTVGTNESILETPNISPFGAFALSEFAPSGWPLESIVTYREDDGSLLYEEGTFSERYWMLEGISLVQYDNAGSKGKTEKTACSEQRDRCRNRLSHILRASND